MPIFITQGRYSQQAIQGMAAKPEDRAESVHVLFESLGGRLHAYYVTFGEHDFLTIGEAPDEKAMLGILATAAASGGVTDLKTTLAVTSAEAKDGFARAQNAASRFRPAGQS